MAFDFEKTKPIERRENVVNGMRGQYRIDVRSYRSGRTSVEIVDIGWPSERKDEPLVQTWVDTPPDLIKYIDLKAYPFVMRHLERKHGRRGLHMNSADFRAFPQLRRV